MAASSEIRFKIGADTSALSAGFAKAQSIAAVAGKQLEKKLGLKDAFKASAVALGLSIDHIATKVAEMAMGGSAASWQNALTAAQNTAELMERATLSRMSTLRQISYLEREIANSASEQSATPKTKNGALRFFAETVGVTPGKGMLGTLVNALSKEDESEVETRRAAARDKVKRDEATITALKEQQKKFTEQIADAEDELERIGISDTKRQAFLLEDAERIKASRDEAQKNGAEWQPLQLAYIAKLNAAEQVGLAIAKAHTNEVERRVNLERDLLGAMSRQSKSAEAIGTAKNDKYRFSLDEAIEGTRGTAADQDRARAIKANEDMVRVLMDKGPGATSGREFLGYDKKSGDPMFRNRTAAWHASRADELRAGFTSLKSGERNPFANLEADFKEATKLLDSIDKKLNSEDT